MSTVSRLVKKVPNPVRRLFYAAMPFRYRYGKAFGRVFRRTYGFIMESQWWDYDDLQSYQMERLNRLLNHAYNNVPYYQRVFDERALKPDDIQSVSDLKNLPILTRNIIEENREDLIARGVPKSTLIKCSTSGSTGTPLTFLGTDDIYKKEAAFVTRAFHAHGACLYDEKSIWLRRYVPEESDPLFKYDYELKRLYLSAYHLSLDIVQEYVDLMDSYGARVLVGYPSSLYILALLLEQSGLRLKNIETAHAASEKMLDEWKKKIEGVLGVPVKCHYGMIEKVSMFFQCEHSDYYHESVEYGVTELINERDGMAQVVGTGFLNYAMPLIRYRVNDHAIVNHGNHMCKCGRKLPLSVKDFAGRSDDILVTPDGRYLPGVNFYTMIYKIHGVKMFQIVQYAKDAVEAKIVPDDSFDEDSVRLLKKGFSERLGEKVNIQIGLVDKIERNKETGKIRCIVNEIEEA